jgi:hypothetical protein
MLRAAIGIEGEEGFVLLASGRHFRRRSVLLSLRSIRRARPSTTAPEACGWRRPSCNWRCGSNVGIWDMELPGAIFKCRLNSATSGSSLDTIARLAHEL